MCSTWTIKVLTSSTYQIVIISVSSIVSVLSTSSTYTIEVLTSSTHKTVMISVSETYCFCFISKVYVDEFYKIVIISVSFFVSISPAFFTWTKKVLRIYLQKSNYLGKLYCFYFCSMFYLGHKSPEQFYLQNSNYLRRKTELDCANSQSF